MAGGAGGAARAARDLPSAEENAADARGAVTEPRPRPRPARARSWPPSLAGGRRRARRSSSSATGSAPRSGRTAPRTRTSCWRPTPPRRRSRRAPPSPARCEGQASRSAAAYDAMATHPRPARRRSRRRRSEPPAAPSPGMGVDAAERSAGPDPTREHHSRRRRRRHRPADRRLGHRHPGHPGDPGRPFARAARRAGRARRGRGADPAADPGRAAAGHRPRPGRHGRSCSCRPSRRCGRPGPGTVGAGRRRPGRGMVGSEEQTRESVSRRAQQIFDEAQHQVEQLLEPLQPTAIARWEAGADPAVAGFHDSPDRVKRWIDERHSGVGGAIVAVGDYIAGLPDWVTDEYNRGRARVRRRRLRAAARHLQRRQRGHRRGAGAHRAAPASDIDDAFTAMEAEFPRVGGAGAARSAACSTGSASRSPRRRPASSQDVSQRAVTAVNEVHAEARRSREAARADRPGRRRHRGVHRRPGQARSSTACCDWSASRRRRSGRSIARIEQVISDIANDPENFINNLVAGAQAGLPAVLRQLRARTSSRASGTGCSPGSRPRSRCPGTSRARSLFSFALAADGHHVAAGPRDPRAPHRSDRRRGDRGGVAADFGAHRARSGGDRRADQGAADPRDASSG